MSKLLIGLLISAAALLAFFLMHQSGVTNSSDSSRSELTAKRTIQTAAPLSVPKVPDQPPKNTAYLPNNIYEVVCKLGHPFMVKSWDLDPDTRFVYFVGPFTSKPDESNPTVYNYMYISIPGINRTRSQTTLFMESVDAEPTEVQHEELSRFLIPRIQGIPDRLAEVKKTLGEAAAERELSSGRTRMVFDGHMCVGEQYLAGMYIDVENGQIVKAKGVEHPEKLKWVLSGGRSPLPDTEPTYYTDMYMRTPDAQSRLLIFLELREKGDKEGASEHLALGYFPFPNLVDEITVDPHPQGKLEFDTATYQTLRYSLEEMEIRTTYQLDTGVHVKAIYKMRLQDERWGVSQLVSEETTIP
ncbi:MAG: hypothetical protein OEZ68_12400 [Gammaproteobacteria bacterium]|nr:hypothetical protein [Gammaproteobacteria bacterium]MDH5801596.1 hypothetical protein [Gammaproteobacteria bacterium]